jgi:hypothetical protein
MLKPRFPSRFKGNESVPDQGGSEVVWRGALKEARTHFPSYS